MVRDPEEPGEPRRTPGPGVLLVTLTLSSATAVGLGFEWLGLGETSIVLVYLLGVVGIATWIGRVPAIVASFGSVLAFNFFFIPPRWTFRVDDRDYVFTFTVMLLIALLIGALTGRIRDQSSLARVRELRTERLYRLSRILSASRGREPIAAAGREHLVEILGTEVEVLLPGEDGALRPLPRTPPGEPLDSILLERATAVLGSGLAVESRTTRDRVALLTPLVAPEGSLGVVVVLADEIGFLRSADRLRTIGACCAQVALALQRDALTDELHRSTVRAETERLRSALLSSVSHDLRTPLAAICGASSSLIDAEDRIGPSEQRALLQSVYDEANRLARLVDNLLQMTRIESGHLSPRREWNVVEDLVGSALTRMDRTLSGHPVRTHLPAEIPLIRVDDVLIDLVLCNLIENAAKYTRPEAPIDITASVRDGWVRIEVADRGPGLTREEKRHAFEKFYRGPGPLENGTRGAGLGLAISAAVASLHGGRLTVEDRSGGGAVFALELPLEEQPPAISDEAIPEGAEEPG